MGHSPERRAIARLTRLLFLFGADVAARSLAAVTVIGARRMRKLPLMPSGRGWPSRRGRYLLAVGLHATSLVIAVGERLPSRQPRGHPRTGRGAA